MKDYLQGTATCDMHGEYNWYFNCGPQNNEVIIWSGERFKNVPDGLFYNNISHKWTGYATCPRCGKRQMVEVDDDTE